MEGPPSGASVDQTEAGPARLSASSRGVRWAKAQSKCIYVVTARERGGRSITKIRVPIIVMSINKIIDVSKKEGEKRGR